MPIIHVIGPDQPAIVEVLADAELFVQRASSGQSVGMSFYESEYRPLHLMVPVEIAGRLVLELITVLPEQWEVFRAALAAPGEGGGGSEPE